MARRNAAQRHVGGQRRQDHGLDRIGRRFRVFVRRDQDMRANRPSASSSSAASRPYV
jgi:hypothetical protein